MRSHSAAGDIPVSREVRAFYLSLAEEAERAEQDGARTTDSTPASLACACILGLMLAVALLALVVTWAWAW